MRTPIRTVVTGVAFAALVALVPQAAWAAGADGVDLTPQVLVDAEGLMPVALDGQPVAGEILVANTNDEPRTVRVFAVSARRSDGDGVTLGEPGSAPWFGLADQRVELEPGERRTLAFLTDPGQAPEPDASPHVAVVLEVERGNTLTLQAANLVPIRAGEAPAGLPGPWAWIALGLLVLVTGGHVAARRWGLDPLTEPVRAAAPPERDLIPSA